MSVGAARVLSSHETKSSRVSSQHCGKSLRINQPGDGHEKEADHVADHLISGHRLPAWSIAKTRARQIQRDPLTQPPAAQPNNYGEALGKIAEAFLATPAGKEIVKFFTDQPLVKSAIDFVQTLGGIAIAGSAAVGAVSTLALTHKALPAQIPAIPLDILQPGLKLKINYEGPVNHPTQAMITLSYEGKASKKKGGPTDKERFQNETQRIAADQAQFRAGMHTGPGAPADPQQLSDESMAKNYELRRMAALLKSGGPPPLPGQFTPLVPGTQPLNLHMRDGQAPVQPAPSESSPDTTKKEELPVQREVESTLTAPAEINADAGKKVESVLNSPGRPMDHETRRSMESHIGFDFSKVRIHTDREAAASAHGVGARAYTVGNDVVFADGRYSPGTTEGRRLIAHELTHTVQQSENAPAKGRMSLGRSRDPFEVESNQASRTIGSPASPTQGSMAPRLRTRRQTLQKYEAFEHAQFGETQGILVKAVADRAYVYKVQAKESLKQIATKFGVAEEDLVAANNGKIKRQKDKLDPKKVIQGFTPGDEIIIPPVLTEATKEALKSRELALTVNGISMTYGEGIALGDFFDTAEEMLAATPANLTRLVQKIRDERSAGKAFSAEEWDIASNKRYVDLALKNDSHFAPPNSSLASESGNSRRNHKSEWEQIHRQALTDSQRGDKEKALATNAFADHSLTDAFAAGHLFNRRDAVDIFEGKLPKTADGKDFTDPSKAVFDEVAKKSFVGPVKAAFTPYETVKFKGVIFRPNIDNESTFSRLLQGIHLEEPLQLEGAVVKGAHDRLNKAGVEVENAKGDKWTLSGDGTLNAKSLEVGRKAVGQSQFNVLEVFKRATGLDLTALFRKVWDFVPHPTAAVGEKQVRDTVSSGTDPKSPDLINAIVTLIKENYDLILNKLVAKGILKKA
jgi:hypothetical protein